MIFCLNFLVRELFSIIFPFLFCVGTRLAVTLRGDESYEQLDILKSVDDITMLLHNVPYGEEKTGRVHAARR